MRLLSALSLALPATLAAQSPTLRTLSRIEAEFPEPFTSIGSIRELSDGRVIVVDRVEGAVKLLDFKSGIASPVSRKGAGPLEWGLPGRLFVQRGDTTLLSDGENVRYLVLGPGAKPLSSFSLDEGSDQRMIGLASGISQTGAFYFVDSRYTPRSAGVMSTETDQVVWRRTRGSARVDTVATLAVPQGRFMASRDVGGGRLYDFNSRPMWPEDIAAYASDGRVAIVRGADYHVEWIATDGKVTKGAPASFTPIRVTDAEKKAFIERSTRTGRIITFVQGGGAAAPGGSKAMPAPRAGSPGDMLAESNISWPPTKAAFVAGAASIAPDGRLWVLRTRAYNDSIPTYDVFDAAARLVDRVALSHATRLVGFGANAIYIARTDADDLVYLQRVRIR